MKKDKVQHNMKKVSVTMASQNTALWILGSLAITACGVYEPSVISINPVEYKKDKETGGFVRSVDAFQVLDKDGKYYKYPFLGGLNVPRPQFIDLDDDRDLDLLLQERTGELMYFENMGTAEEADFVWRTDRYQDLDIGEWSRLLDFDQDGDLDMLTEHPFSYIQYFQNQGTPQNAKFIAVGDSVRDVNSKPLFADRQNIPSLNDIDCDGNWDLFLGRVDGTISRYETSSKSSEEAPLFRFVEDRFQGIEIVAQLGSLHGANSMAFADLDDDGDLDFFWGDFFEPSILYLENTGSCNEPVLLGDPLPLEVEGSLSTSGYNAPTLADIDDDGDLDLFVGVLGGAFNPNLTTIKNFLFYEQVDRNFVQRSSQFIYTLDVGSESIPTLADLDDDGDLDLLVSNKIDSEDPYTARMYQFENIGSAQDPSFQEREPINLFATYHYAPAIGDLDNDGDLDMLVGTWNKGVSFYRNEGSRKEPDFVLVDTTFVKLTRGSNSTPALADLDGDGDLDLFVGESSGELNFYRNIGTPQEPSFELVSDKFQDIDAGRRSFPIFADMNEDGKKDLLLGREPGGVLLYIREGNTTDPVFVQDSTFTLPLPNYSTPSVADIDGDSDLDIFSGGLAGGVIFLENLNR